MSRRSITWAALALCLVALAVAAVRVAAAPTGRDLPAADRVVVVGIPGLEWEDIDASRTPQLHRLAGEAATGLMTDRGARSVSCEYDGWTTLGAGNRARYSNLGSNTVSCGLQASFPPNLRRAATANESRSFDARPGLLGRQVRCVDVFGAGPELAAGAATVRSRKATDVPGAQSRCPVSLVGWPGLTDGPARQRSVASADALLGELRTSLASDPDTTLVVLGLAETRSAEPRAVLHPALVLSGDGTAGGVLRSASTGRTPYVQLIDVAPTILRALGREAPASMTGRAWRTDADDRSGTERIAAYADANQQATRQGGLTTPFFWVWDALVVAFCLGAVLALRGRRPAAWVRSAGVVVAAVPVATFLAGLVPWWRLTGGMAVSVVAATAVVSAIALLGPWRRHRFGPAVALAVIGVITLGLDVATGSHLQLATLLGYNPIVAGRFTGFGNMPFAVYATCGLIALAALLGAQPPGRTHRLRWVALAVGGTLVALDGVPGVGSDFGGVLALVPALVLMTVAASGQRLSPLRVVLAVGSGVAVVAALAIADYQRAAGDQTHLGRFVGQVLNGTAWQVVERKGEANLGLLVGSPIAVLVPVLVVTVVWLLRDERFGRLVGEHGAPLRAALVGVGTVALLGTALNDSGIAVLVAAGAVAVPLLLSALAPRKDEP